jgi:ferredoxin
MAAPIVTIVSSGEEFGCLEGRSVLVAMEQQGRHGIQVGCRNGGCGVCRVEVLSGSFVAKKMSKAFVTEDDLAHGIVLSCRIYPESDLTVRPCPKQPDLTNVK